MMSTQLRPHATGQTLGVAGGVCVVVIRGGDSGEHMTCAGETLVPQRPAPCSAAAAVGADGVRPGELLRDPATGLEVRCIRGGPGPLAHGGRTMVPLRLDRPVHASTR